jgi:hypothetical protein
LFSQRMTSSVRMADVEFFMDRSKSERCRVYQHLRNPYI